VYIRVKMGGIHWKMPKMGRKLAEIRQKRKSQWSFSHILMADTQHMYSNKVYTKYLAIVRG
jgi:hypothetical protein